MADKHINQGFINSMRLAIEAVAKSVMPKTVILGTATNVTDVECTAQIDDASDVPNVRLNAIITDGADSYATIIPKEGSYILIGIIENDKTDAVVLACSEVEKITGKIGTTQFTADASGLHLERQGQSLAVVLDALLDALLQLTVTTGTGPSGTPINASAFTDVKNKLAQILN